MKKLLLALLFLSPFGLNAQSISTVDFTLAVPYTTVSVTVRSPAVSVGIMDSLAFVVKASLGSTKGTYSLEGFLEYYAKDGTFMVTVATAVIAEGDITTTATVVKFGSVKLPVYVSQVRLAFKTLGETLPPESNWKPKVTAYFLKYNTKP